MDPGPRYAFIAVAAARSNSPILGLISLREGDVRPIEESSQSGRYTFLVIAVELRPNAAHVRPGGRWTLPPPLVRLSAGRSASPGAPPGPRLSPGQATPATIRSPQMEIRSMSEALKRR